jgi:predicted amidophosphoribosyltransferase
MDCCKKRAFEGQLCPQSGACQYCDQNTHNKPNSKRICNRCFNDLDKAKQRRDARVSQLRELQLRAPQIVKQILQS